MKKKARSAMGVITQSPPPGEPEDHRASCCFLREWHTSLAGGLRDNSECMNMYETIVHCELW